MTEQQPLSREVPGKLIFDKNGKPIGVVVNDGSLDYASHGDKENITIVIRPPEKKEDNI